MLTDALGWDQIDIDPFLAGILVLDFIYGAYFTKPSAARFFPCRAASLKRARPTA